MECIQNCQGLCNQERTSLFPYINWCSRYHFTHHLAFSRSTEGCIVLESTGNLILEQHSHTQSNNNLFLHVPSSQTNAYYYSVFVMQCVPETLYLTLLLLYLALTNLKRLCLIVYSHYCCLYCIVCFLLLGRYLN